MKIKSLFFLVIFLAIGGSLFAQVGGQNAATLSNPYGGDLKAGGANCSGAQVCAWQKLPTNPTTTSVVVSGTFSATIQFEESADGVNFVSASPASATIPGTTTFTVNGFTDFRVRVSAYVSGTVSVNITTQTAGTGGGGGGGSSFPVTTNVTVNSGGSISATGTGIISATTVTNVTTAPSGACSPNGSLQILTSVPVQIYKCVAGSWQPDFSTVIDAKAYGVKADAKICIGTFVVITSASTSVNCFSGMNSSAAAVAGNVATISFSGNPLTVGAIPWATGNSVTITNFTGGDTYFNGTFTLTGVTATTVTFALVHANASATTFGTVMNNNVGPFSTAADVTAGPKLIFGTSGAGGRDLSQAGTLILPQGSISSVTNSFTAVASIAATSSSGASNSELVWGSDDTAALTATSVALANALDCGVVLLPQGGMLDSVGQWQIDSPGCIYGATNGTSIQYGSGAVVKGWGPNVSKIIPLPLFDFTTVRNNSLFGSPNFMVYDEWSIYGAGLGTNGNNTLSIVTMNTESVGINFEIVAWLGADVNTTGLTFNGRCWACRVQGAGGTGMNVVNGPSQFTNGVVNYSKFAALTIQGTIFNSTASVFGSTGTPGRIQNRIFSGTWNSTNDQISGPVGAATNDICLEVDTGATANLVNMNDSTAPCGGAGTAIGIYNHGGTVRATNSTIAGGTTGNAILQDLSAKFFDNSGNVLSGSTTLFNNSSGTLFGSSSITGTPAVGNFVESTCGTTTTTAVQANSSTLVGSFTITFAGAPGTTCTITYTYPTSPQNFWLAPSKATITAIAGTNAFPTAITRPTLTATSVAWTISGPTFTNGNTLIFDYDVRY